MECVLTFQILTLSKYLTKTFDIILGVTPILAPQSVAPPEMSTPALQCTAYDPTFSLQDLFSTLKMMMFAKN